VLFGVVSAGGWVGEKKGQEGEGGSREREKGRMKEGENNREGKMSYDDVRESDKRKRGRDGGMGNVIKT
jgi:hypothetical protein